MRFVHDGVGIEYMVDFAAAGGAPLLFLHGLSGASTTYDEVVALLGDLDRPIYRLDLRGHGQSDRAPGTYSVPFYAADVIAFIESVVARPVVLLGHSLGGVITHHIAATRPDLILGALTEDPPLYFCNQELFDRSMFSQVFPILEAQMRELQARGATFDEVRSAVANAPTPWGTAETTVFPKGIDSRALEMMSADPDVWVPAIKGGALSGYNPDASIACPLTILQADPTMGPAFWSNHVALQQAANPHADIRLIDGAPHGIHTFITGRDRYLQAVRDLVAKV
jgi:pimeloyl-ACP methyl ester carboxylesterase